MNTEHLQQAGDALNREAQQLWSLVRSLRQTGLDSPETEAFGDLSSYDQHPADHGSETFEREKDLGLLLDTYEQLDQLAHAKKRLESGSYGTCEECHWPIGQERLAALPSATLCLKCKQERELTQDNFHRPVEEDVLSPPFARTFDKNAPSFDGEDTWQAVASFGTANSPQDVPDSSEFDDAYVEADEDEGIVDRTDGIIDLDYMRVSDQQEIYPDLENNPRHLPHELDMLIPGDDPDIGASGFNSTDMGFTALTGTPDTPEQSDIDMDLWDFIRAEFPGDPEMEMADELTPEQMDELAKEYELSLRDEKPGRD